MARQVIVDTGPLVAWLDRRDRSHRLVRDWLATFDGELISTWPVLTEVCHLLPAHIVADFMQWVARGGLAVVELPPTAALHLAESMGKYADLPMDLADASLVWLADATGVRDVLTLDTRDFGVYRTRSGRALRDVLRERPDSRPGSRS
jgi:hypothetical protein